MENKPKKQKKPSLALFFIVWLCCALLIFAAVGAVTWFGSTCTMPQDAAVSLHARADGTISAQWTAAPDADGYRVKVLDAGTGKELLSETVTQPQAVFSGRYADSVLKIVPYTDFYFGFIQAEKPGRGSIQAECSISVPTIQDFHWSTDPASGTLRAQWNCSEPDALFSLCLVQPSGETQELLQTAEHQLVIRFGENGAVPLPGADEAYRLEVVSRAQWENVTAYGGAVGEMQVSRSELCPAQLQLSLEDLGQNRYAVHWQQTAGREFLLELRGSNGGILQHSFAADSPAEYLTGSLNPFETYSLSLTARGGFGREAQETAAFDSLEFKTGASSLYATCWPNRDLDLYDEPDGTKIGTVPVLQACCILDETDHWFKVLTGPESSGWISSDLCLINLPEYCGKLMNYDITNSYSSLYAVHEYAIAEVTGTV
ncbi:MAG: hypothetical protein MJ135_08115, partial [Oscillospiraceae bacterium]|nr:hypothetical protein [Oscillospiraceae bacterium]